MVSKKSSSVSLFGQEVIQVLLKDPVIQECRYRTEETELLTGQVSSKSALQVKLRYKVGTTGKPQVQIGHHR